MSSNLRRSSIRQTIDKWSILDTDLDINEPCSEVQDQLGIYQTDLSIDYIFLVADLGTSYLSITLIHKSLYYFIPIYVFM